jgi:hypothetical protein
MSRRDVVLLCSRAVLVCWVCGMKISSIQRWSIQALQKGKKKIDECVPHYSAAFPGCVVVLKHCVLCAVFVVCVPAGCYQGAGPCYAATDPYLRQAATQHESHL